MTSVFTLDKPFHGFPCDEILRNHSKGLSGRFYALWARSRYSTLRLSVVQIGRSTLRPFLHRYFFNQVHPDNPPAGSKGSSHSC
ncbi:hypothetical protein EMIT0194P_100177 [Pseudomonas serbica]